MKSRGAMVQTYYFYFLQTFIITYIVYCIKIIFLPLMDVKIF